jgi:glycosyltransferase involved in cell wall biosynthesis
MGDLCDLDATIARGETAFADGDLVAARALLTACATHPTATTRQRVEALNNLAVIAAAQHRPGEAERYLLDALALDGSFLPALENLAAWCAQRGDLVQATHWSRRATEVSPDDPAGWHRLADVLRARHRADEAAAALASAPNDGGGPQTDPAVTPDGLPAPTSAAPPPGVTHVVQRVLIVVDRFFPAVGGTERLAESVGAYLQSEGIAVEVATRPASQRSSAEHRSMRIHELHDVPAGLSELVRARSYDVVLAFSNATVWPVLASLQLPQPRPRIVVVPCVNAKDAAELRGNEELLRAFGALVATADVLGYSSRSGYDIRLWEDLGLSGEYVPNAVERIAPRGPSPVAGVPRGASLLLVVGNFWPEKNHTGLLHALRHRPPGWHIAMIGGASPEYPSLIDEVTQLAQRDPCLHLVGPATPEQVSAAMQEAQILLLPSAAEATPLVLLEAMSHRLPWIATPSCGAAHDHAGGLILALDQFREGIGFLLDTPPAARTLGDAGHAHWRHCYTWEVVGPRYGKMLRGEALPDLRAPEPAIAATETVRARFYDGRPAASVNVAAAA